MSIPASPPGTQVFDGPMASRGYALNKLCYSFNDATAREAFVADESGYCDRFGLSAEQKAALLNRDVLALQALGGSIYYLAKFAGVLGLSVQDIGGLQTGMSTDDFKAMLIDGGNRRFGEYDYE